MNPDTKSLRPAFSRKNLEIILLDEALVEHSADNHVEVFIAEFQNLVVDFFHFAFLPVNCYTL